MRKITTSLFFLVFSVLVFGQTGQKFETMLDGITVQDICGDGQNLWIATNGSGIFKYNIKTKTLENYSTSNGAIKHDFFFCLAANENYVWAGSTDGLFIFDKKTGRWTSRKFGKGGQLGNWIRSLAYDKYENV